MKNISSSFKDFSFSFFSILLFSLLMIGCSDDMDPGSEVDDLTTNEKLALLTEFQKETIDYFVDIALGFEFGNVSKITRKWKNTVRIKVEGEQPDYLLDELDLIIEELNALTSDGHGIVISSGTETPNFRIFFGTGEEYARINPNAENQIAGNRGLFYVNWNSNQNLISGDMYVDTETIEEVFQRHLLREELTQALGLAMDSPRYNQSIFQQSWTSVTSFASIDEELIRLLYHPDMRSGLNEGQVRVVLTDILYEEL